MLARVDEAGLAVGRDLLAGQHVPLQELPRLHQTGQRHHEDAGQREPSCGVHLPVEREEIQVVRLFNRQLPETHLNY